jgi:trehalose synthase
VLRDNATELAALVRTGDVVVLHDPQTAGMIPAMRNDGAKVVWRCHIGHEDLRDPHVTRAWAFLAPYLAEADATVFSRPAYVPDCCQDGRIAIIRPTIDPFSPKNQDLAPEVVQSILVRSGIAGGRDGRAAPVFRRSDGTPGRVDRGADILRTGPAPTWDVPLVVQVSRWDRLKDPIGVMEGFVRLEAADAGGASLVLAGPTVTGVADDPDGPAVLAELTHAWRALPHERRCRVQIVCLPMTDPGENAAIVNALQRHATVVVQKSLQEGFGLTVTEAMWKARPVVASAVGGIVDQITDGRDGVLIDDPADRDAFAAALGGLLTDPAGARRIGEAARERVRREGLGMHGLVGWARLMPELVG